MTVLVDGKYYEDATYNTQFMSVMNGTAPAQFAVGATEPTDTSVLWVDTTSGTKPVLKVYIINAWVAVVDTAE